MKYVLEVREIMDRGLWDRVCDLRGINPWAVNEGLMDAGEELTFTDEEAHRLGLVETPDSDR